MALVSGLVMFGAVGLMIMKGRMTFDFALRNPISVFAGAMALAGLALAFSLKGMMMKPGDRPADPGVALQKYQVFVLIRAALVEGGALFSAVAVLVTCNILPACLFVVCAVVLVAFRPTQQEFTDLFGARRS